MKPHVYLFALLLCGCGGEASPTRVVTLAPEPLLAATADANPESIESVGPHGPVGEPARGADEAVTARGGDAEAGKATYTAVCMACHQADGTGMNGMLAGDFVHDESRLAKPDEELMHSVKKGKTGKIGTMPPMEGILSDEEIQNALAYIRREFGD